MLTRRVKNPRARGVGFLVRAKIWMGGGLSWMEG